MSLIFRENIRTLIEKTGLNISGFAAQIGEKASRLNDVLQGKQRPPFDMLEKIINTFQVNGHWLITGTGEMFADSKNKNNSENEDFSLIPMFDIEVSAGFGSWAYGASEPSTHLAYRKDWLTQRGLQAQNLSVVTARGDSMEPTIHHGDTLLIDMSQSIPRDGHIYVIRSDDMLWVKRIQRQLGGGLLLISDNDSYPPMLLNAQEHENTEIIGQVVSISKDFS